MRQEVFITSESLEMICNYITNIISTNSFSSDEYKLYPRRKLRALVELSMYDTIVV